MPPLTDWFGSDKENTGSSNYPYVTARVRSLRSHLLPREEFNRMIARSEHEIARSLQEGRYREAIDDLASEYSGAQLVERATWQSLGEEFKSIHSWCEGQLRGMLGEYFERFTVYNLKTVLRGARSGAQREEVLKALLPVGSVSPEDLEPVLSAETFDEAVELLPNVPYKRIVEEHREEPQAVLENALDKAFYERLLSTVDASNRPQKAYLRFLRREIDETNLQIVFRAKHAGVDTFEFVPGGEDVDEDLARRIHSAEWEEVPSLVEETPYGTELRDAVEDYIEHRDLNEISNVLDRLHLQAADEFGHRYPLSILPILEYVLRKQREVERLRMIAFGKQADLSQEEIKELIED